MKMNSIVYFRKLNLTFFFFFYSELREMLTNYGVWIYLDPNSKYKLDKNYEMAREVPRLCIG